MSVATTEDIQALQDQIAKLTAILAGGAPALAPRPQSYGVDEAAKILGRAPYTVREWCREGQCNAFKLKGWRHGPNEKWRISAEEIDRIRSEGLLPADASRNRGKSGT